MKIISFFKNPNWGYLASILQVSYFIKDTIQLATSQLTFNQYLHTVDWLNLIWMLVISAVLVQLLKLVKAIKLESVEMKKVLDDSLLLSFRIFKNSCISDGPYGGNDWIEKLKYHFNVKQIVKIIKMEPINDKDVAELIKNNTLTVRDIEGN